MRNFRKVILNNSILILIIAILCISIPIGYVYLDNIIFNKTLVKTPEKEYNPLPHTTIKLQRAGKDITLDFSHLSAPTDDYKTILYVYKDSSNNEYFLDTKYGNLIGVSFAVEQPQLSGMRILTAEELKVKAVSFISEIIDIDKYELDNEIFDDNRVNLSWSRHVNKIPTCDSVAVTMYRDGTVKSFVINNKGFYDKNAPNIPVIVDGYADEAAAEAKGAEFLINSVNMLRGTDVTTYVKNYSKLKIDTDLQLYWEFVFRLNVSQDNISNGIQSEYIVKVNAITMDVSFK
jgi:hypothetical protein